MNKDTEHKRDLSDFFQLGLKSDRADTYSQSYPHLIAFFAGVDKITSTDFVCAAHMAYGWMPTILELDPKSPGNFDYEATLLNRARDGCDLADEELEVLKKTINHSLVGASKVLHFAAPDRYGIWDSRVCAFLYTNTPLTQPVARPQHDQINRLDRFLHYQELLRELKSSSGFSGFYKRICNAVGEVSATRAIELVMYDNSPPYRTKEHS